MKYTVIEDGIEYDVYKNVNGQKTLWYLNNSLGRINGPARIYFNEDKKEYMKEYWLNGKYYPDIESDEEWILFQIIT